MFRRGFRVSSTIYTCKANENYRSLASSSPPPMRSPTFSAWSPGGDVEFAFSSWNSALLLRNPHPPHFPCGTQLEFHFSMRNPAGIPLFHISMCGLRTEFTPKSAETPWTPRGIHKDSTWTFTVKSANSNEKVNTRECEVRR